MPLDTVTFGFRPAGAPIPDVTLRSTPDLLTGLRRSLRRLCPACGQGKLFCGYLAVRPICAVCGNDNEQYPSDDFAPYVTISLVLHLMVPVLFLADRAWDMSVWSEGAVALSHLLTGDACSAAVREGRGDRPRLGVRREAQSRSKLLGTVVIRGTTHRTASRDEAARSRRRMILICCRQSLRAGCTYLLVMAGGGVGDR